VISRSLGKIEKVSAARGGAARAGVRVATTSCSRCASTCADTIGTDIKACIVAAINAAATHRRNPLARAHLFIYNLYTRLSNGDHLVQDVNQIKQELTFDSLLKNGHSP
jgi:hypothetical protein